MGLCYLSLKTSSTLVVFIEVVASVTIAALCVLSWKSMDQPASFTYHPKPKESPDLTNSKIQACVTFWILTLVFVMVTIRLAFAALLLIAVSKKKAGLAKAWMAVKVFLIIFAIFLSIASMTVGFYTKVAALADLGFHVITVYYVKVLYESLGELEQVLILDKNDAAT